MRNLFKALAVVALLAAPVMADVSVQVLVNGGATATINVGDTATVTVQVQDTTAGVGVASLGGDIVSSGAGGVTASGFAFASAWNRVTPTYTNFLSIVGAAGANGAWTGFGTMQANGTDLPTSTTAAYGNGAWSTVATYSVTATAAGTVTLVYSVTGPSNGWVGGFKADGTDDVGITASSQLISATITINNLVLPPTVTNMAGTFNGSANSLATYGSSTFILAVSPATNDFTITPTYGGGAATSYQWSIVSETAAPFGVALAQTSFETPTAATTRVRFTRNGTYVLKVTATNGAGSGSGQISIRVTSCDIDASGGVVNAGDRGRMNAAFNNMTNLWCDIDGSGGVVNAGDRGRMNAAFNNAYTIVAYPGNPFQ